MQERMMPTLLSITMVIQGASSSVPTMEADSRHPVVATVAP